MKIGHLEHARNSIKVIIQRNLSHDDEAALRNAVKTLNQFWVESLPISILNENRDELIAQTEALAARHFMDSRLFDGAQQLERHLLVVNRLFCNFLSSARSYIDLTRHRLSANMLLSGTFSTLCSTAYDSSFSYRLLEAVRNISQHSQLPLQGFSGSRDFVDLQQSSYDFLFDRDKLLSDNKFKPSLRNELSAQEERFPATPHIVAYAESLWNIHMRITENSIESYASAADELESVLSDIPWGKFPFVGEVEEHDGKLEFKLLAIPFRSIEMIRAMHGLILQVDRQIPGEHSQ